MRIWIQASEMAMQTPPERNRYVDFLRAISVLIVIAGHWLITTAYYFDGTLKVRHLFEIQPQTQWLTWVFQVMPVFFIVGGYSNAVSLDSAHRKGTRYPDWLSARLHRLVTPLLVLLFTWGAIAIILNLFGVSPEVIQLASQASLIPTWFLSIYIMVVIFAPLTYKLWRRFGLVSFWALAVVAVFVDLVYFAAGIHWLSWSNYFWVWLAIHGLGYAWRDRRVKSAKLLLMMSALALFTMWILVFYGPYPLAMVGSPDQSLSNTTPPKVTLLALGIFQFGLLLVVENPMRLALNNLRLWTSIVLINSMIMTVYLWHVTIMIAFIGLIYFFEGPGLSVQPGTLNWWFLRPLWMAILLLWLVPLCLLLSPLERSSRSSMSPAISSLRQVSGAMLICLGVALLAMYGFGGGPFYRLDLATIAMITVGAGISGLIPGLR
jgi:peptidoglycan/LPS O-acetylase OafA/YrhL